MKIQSPRPNDLAAVLSEDQLKHAMGIMIGASSGILSDTEIQELCVLPETYYDEAGHDAALQAFRSNNPNLNTWPMAQHAVDAINAESERLKQLYTLPVTEQIKNRFEPMISDFKTECIRETSEGAKVLSYGLSSFGYDVRVSDKFRLFTNANGGIIDPKNGGEDCLVDAKVHTDAQGCEYVILPPNSYVLGVTPEYFKIPRNVMVICVGKSTYARAGAIVNVTPIEPGFHGNVVIEISNSTSLPMKVYVNEGIAQFIFFRGNKDCKTSYADRKGKYQGQTGLTLGKV